MAEIERKDLISDEALKAPVILTVEFTKLLDVVNKVKANSKDLSAQIQASDSTGKVAKATNQLTTEEKELIKVQEQISRALAQSSQEYQDYKAGLDAINKATKEGQILGDKKATQVTKENASLKQLETALDKNRAAYANLRNEEARKSESGKKLLLVIQQQDKEVNELRKSIGKFTVETHDSEKAVETLKDRIKEAGNEFGGASNKISGAVTLLKELASSKAALVLGGIGLAVGGVVKAITTYFETTVSGHEFIALIEGRIEGYKGYLTKRLAEVGKQIIQEGPVATIKDYLKSIIDYQNLSDEEKKALQNKGKSFEEILNEKVKPGTHSIDEITKLREEARKEYEEQRTELQKAGDLGEELAAEEIRHKKDIAKATRENAALELESNEALEKSRAQLLYSDEQRVEFLKQAKELRGKVLETNIELAEKEKEHLIAEAHLSSDQPRILQAQADAEAKILNLRSEYLAHNRRIDSQISTLEVEIFKRQVDNVRKEEDIRNKSAKEEIEADILRNEELLKVETTYGPERLKALVDIGEARLEILRREKAQEVLVAKRAEQDKLIAEGGKDISDEAIEKIKHFQNEKLSIEAAYASKEIALNKKTTETINAALLDDFHKSVAQQKLARTKGQEEIIAIDKAYIDGEIVGYENYLRIRRQAEIKFDNEGIQLTLKNLEDELALRRSQGLLTVEQEQKIQDTILQVKENANRRDIEGKRKTQEALVALEQQAFATARDILENSYQKQSDELQSSIDSRVAKLEKAKDVELLIAGDNAEAKASIEEKYANKEKAVQAEQAVLQRKRAAAEQKLSAFEIVIRTASAVLKAYAEVPFPYDSVVAASYAGIGALQLAAVLTKPLPAFELGTSFAPGGLALTGEKGFEKVVEPSGNVYYTPDRPTVLPIRRGSVIIPHDETMKELASSFINYDTTPFQPTSDAKTLKKLSDIEYAITNKSQPIINITKEGLRVMVQKAQERIIFLDQFYK